MFTLHVSEVDLGSVAANKGDAITNSATKRPVSFMEKDVPGRRKTQSDNVMVLVG